MDPFLFVVRFLCLFHLTLWSFEMPLCMWEGEWEKRAELEQLLVVAAAFKNCFVFYLPVLSTSKLTILHTAPYSLGNAQIWSHRLPVWQQEPKRRRKEQIAARRTHLLGQQPGLNAMLLTCGHSLWPAFVWAELASFRAMQHAKTTHATSF